MKKNKIDIFLEISDLLFYSIDQGNEDLARNLITFLTKTFIEFRKNKEGEEIVYPDEFYSTIFQANELVCIKPKKTISYLNGSIFLNLFIDSYQKTIISNKTYNALWVGIRQALQYNRDDIIMSYWENAHQHMEFSLPHIQPIIEFKKDKSRTLNQNEIDNRIYERKKFLEFHYVLGGLLLYLKKYKLLKNILFYTNQQPAKYHLIPGNLSDIINGFISVSEDYRNPFHYEQIYSFPDINGVNRGSIIRYWTKKYFAILFLRQYTLKEYYTFQNILKLPQIPGSLSEMKEWEDELIYFKKLIEETKKDKELLSSLGLEYLSNDNWYEEHNKQKPIDLIDKIISEVKKKYEEKKEKQSISKEKENEFIIKSKEILLNSISKFETIFEVEADVETIDNENEKEISDDIVIYPLTGSCELLDKTAFSDDQDISYLNFDTIVAQAVSTNTEIAITGSFSPFIKERYLLKREDIFEATKKIIGEGKDFIIISFGLNLEFYLNPLKIKGLKKIGNKFYFNQIEIINLETYIAPDLINSLIVIDKNYLPKLKFNDLPKEIKKRYGINSKYLLDREHFIYGKLIDLNKEVEIKNNISIANDKDLKKKVLACILLNWEIKWEKSSEIYQFNLYEQFRNSGKPNSIDDIITLKDKDKKE